MKCPYCGEEMQHGCIQCRDDIIWSEKKRPVVAFNIGGGKTIELSDSSTNGLFSGTYAEAYLCVKCRKIVMEY